MDDFRFYVLFNNISVISGGWADRKAVWNGTLFTVEKVLPWAGLELGTARSVGQCLMHWAARAPDNLRINKPYFSIKTYFAPIIEMILMRGGNICFRWKLDKLSLNHPQYPGLIYCSQAGYNFFSNVFSEVKFDPEKATVAVGQVTSVRCYLEPATQADAQYIWYDKLGAEVTATSSR